MIYVDNKVIGGNKTFIIAEIGSNHNQDINKAYELIDIAKDCGADAVKFQSIKGDELYQYSKISSEQIKLLNKIQLNEEWYDKIFSYAKRTGIICLSAPTYLNSIDLLIKHNVSIVKIASPQTYGFPQLISKINNMNIPIIMSTGYCLYKDIERAVSLVKNKSKLILLHCVASYPTPVSIANLNFMETLENMFGTIVGYSDHTLGYHITLAAVAKGAKVIEKHITLSRNEDGPDHFFALEPKEFKTMVSYIRDIEEGIGNGTKVNLSPFEIDNREKFEMRIYTKRDMKKGEVITDNDITFFRGDITEVSAWDLNNIIGKQLLVDINKYEPINKYKII